MTAIHFIQNDGRERIVNATDGMSVMRAAIDHDVPGIPADCGGCLSCATCHVHVQEEWMTRLPPARDDELAMLEMAEDRQPNSRLSCQIVVSAAMDGLVVTIPESQY